MWASWEVKLAPCVCSASVPPLNYGLSFHDTDSLAKENALVTKPNGGHTQVAEQRFSDSARAPALNAQIAGFVPSYLPRLRNVMNMNLVRTISAYYCWRCHSL